MLRSYRGILIALAGIAVLVWAFSSGLTFGALNYPQQERYQSYRYASDKPLEIEPAPVGKTNPETFEYRYPCSQPKGKDESDLCAQWKAARAAEASALWAERGFWATVAGIVGLLATIVQSRTALRRAHEANDIARNNIESEQRPWMDFELIELSVLMGDDVTLMPTVSAENIGRSPAVFVTCVPAFMLHGVFFKLPDLSDELDRSMKEIFEIPGLRSETIFPGKKRTLMYPAKCVNPEAFEIYSAQNTQVWITLAVRIAYKFGSSLRWTDHYFKVAGSKWGAGDAQKGLDCHLTVQPISTIPQVGGSVN